MIKTLSFVLLTVLAFGCIGDGEDYTYEPGPDRTGITSKADGARLYKATYTCTGGTGDVGVSVEKTVKAVYIQNTEAGARFVAHSKSGGHYNMTADTNDKSTDTDLMGTEATVSTNTFTAPATIKVVLKGGESGGSYSCTRD
jgi:hypothetical protein